MPHWLIAAIIVITPIAVLDILLMMAVGKLERIREEERNRHE